MLSDGKAPKPSTSVGVWPAVGVVATGTIISAWHLGQRAFLPAASSGTRNSWLHWLHRNSMVMSVFQSLHYCGGRRQQQTAQAAQPNKAGQYNGEKCSSTTGVVRTLEAVGQHHEVHKEGRQR